MSAALDENAPREGAANALIGGSGMVYRPLRELGEGGMARIYLAYGQSSQGVGKLVVLKVMRESQDDAGAREMFLEEARLSARLNHPNIVQVYEVVPASDAPYMVMEYLEGKPLSKIPIGGQITRATVMTILCEALVGLHHAHELRDYDGTPLHIVHRDVSPQNIFVTYDGVVKVLDFGIARIGVGSGRTETGQVKGKLAYMPPEQLLGDDMDRRADIFAVGVMLWEAAVGARLWENVTQANIMHRLATGDIPRPSQRAQVDEELEAIILKATAPEPENRYATALEMRQDLETYVRHAFGQLSTRAVGVALAATFEQERAEHRRVIAAALHESLPPPSVESNPVLLSNAQPDELPRGRSRWPWVAALVLGLAAVTVALWPRSPQLAAPSAEEPSGARLTIHATPPEARILLDGDDRGAGNLVLTVPRDSREHELGVSAPGYVPSERTVRFDSDQEFSITLSPLPRPDARAAGGDLPASSASAEHKSSARSPSTNARAARPALPPPPALKPEAPAAPPAPAPAPTTNCDPPYYFKAGIKTYKPECI